MWMSAWFFARFALGLKFSLYPLIGIINSFGIDYINEGFNVKKEVTVIIETYEEIRWFIAEELGQA